MYQKSIPVHKPNTRGTSCILTDSYRPTLTGSLHVKFHPRMKLSLFLVKCLLLSIYFRLDEILSRDEFTAVQRTRMKFQPRMKSRKHDVQTLHPRMKLNNEQIFFNYDAFTWFLNVKWNNMLLWSKRKSTKKEMDK